MELVVIRVTEMLMDAEHVFNALQHGVVVEFG